MKNSEEDILANINELRALAFELMDKAENLRKDSIILPAGEKRTQAINQILEWTDEAESINTRASELALQMVEKAKEPIKHKPSGFMGSFLFFLVL